MKALIVHGGAGKYREEKREAVRQGLLQTINEGYKILFDGGDALSTCEAAIVSMEDNPTFNAGTGSILTMDGHCQMDAAIMKGSTLEMGAVAAISSVRNPIQLARRVMEETDHILLMGEGAERFARLMGFEAHDPITEARKQEWQALREKYLKGEEKWYWKKLKRLVEQHPELILETVGAIALDDRGEIVVGSSTGGTFLKLFGRVGDTPLPGAGLYATSKGGASATGLGEGIARVLLSKLVCDRMQEGLTALKATEAGMATLDQKLGTSAGVIALDRVGNFGYAQNTSWMPTAFLKEGMGEAELRGFPE